MEFKIFLSLPRNRWWLRKDGVVIASGVGVHRTEGGVLRGDNLVVKLTDAQKTWRKFGRTKSLAFEALMEVQREGAVEVQHPQFVRPYCAQGHFACVEV